MGGALSKLAVSNDWPSPRGLPPDHVWSILLDFGNVYKFNPSVPTSRSTGDESNGLGATRHCNLAPFGSIEERIVTFKEGSRLVVDIFDSEKLSPFEYSIADLKVEPEGTETLFVGALDYQPKGGTLDRVHNSAGARRSFEKAWIRFTADPKCYVETGNEASTIKEVDTSAEPPRVFGLPQLFRSQPG